MSASVAVFAGPSIPPSLRNRWRSVCWYPPARAGDMLSIRNAGHDTIVLIDGYFDHCASPWHKELLDLLSQGIRLVGASSMGALRAAELDAFGMIGVGSIYHAYRSGLLAGDDEVALVHGPEELNWVSLSVPMIEIRATLAAAYRHRLIDRDAAHNIRVIIHDIHFEDRDWPFICKVMAAQGLSADLITWIEQNHVQLKRADAERCVDFAISAGSAAVLSNEAPPRTIFLDRLYEFVAASADSAIANNLSPALPLNG
nr:TfuA-like protein [uncultured Sphingomonas sp.]